MELLELRDRVGTLPSLEKRMASMIQNIQKTEDEIKSLLSQWEQENHDVEKLEKESFSAFLLRLVGKYEDRLEKEQLEAINAKTAYDRAVARMTQLKQEKEALGTRIATLRKEVATFEHEMESRRRALSNHLSEPQGQRYAELENERKTIIAQKTEIDEALRAANRALSTANIISDSLNSAEGWATFDTFTRGGILSHMAKYSHIDEAEQNFNVLSHNLQELKSELNDVEGLTVSGLTEISSGQRTIDFWFDNIFTDLSVRSQIKDNAEQIQQLIRSIDKAKDILFAKNNELACKLDLNKQYEEELLLSINHS